MAEKTAVSSRVGGFQQTRKGTRSYRVDTLTKKQVEQRPSEQFEPDHPSKPNQDFEAALAGTAGEEFDKEASRQKEAASVYHYGPQDVDLTQQGLGTPATLRNVPGVLDKYRGRTAQQYGKELAAVTDDDVLGWLEQTRSPGGSRIVSVLREPIGASGTPAQQAFAKRKQLYEIDYDKALKDGIVERAQVVEESPRSKRQVSRRKLLDELKAAKGFRSDDSRLAFAGTPHGFITIKDGTLPGKYLKKQAKSQSTSQEFAPGIPKQRKILSIPKVRERGANQEWQASLSKHPAARRGDHLDLRLVDRKGKAHSFALNEMPDPGKSTYAVQQATHSGSYALRKKPFSIPLGVYGGTRPGAKVEPKYVQPIEVIKADNKRVHLLRHTGQETEELVMRQVAKAGDDVPIWALTNATKNRNTREGKRLPDAKPRYKDSGVGSVDFTDDQQVMTPKIDGAHTITDFPKADRMVRTYSYRPTQRKSGLIEHTFKFPNFHKLKTPKALQGTMVRTETWASKDGKAIPASEIGGILNSGVPRARNLQADQGIKLRRTVIDVVKHRGRDVSNKPFADKLKIMQEVSKATKGAIELPFVASTPSQKKRMLSVIKGGKFPQTREGVVLHEMGTSGPPTKVKIRPDTDVYVRGIFTKNTSPKGQAAGFSYALKPDGPVVGRVGTGLSRDLRRQMQNSPEQFVGRVAKVQSAGQHVTRAGRTGALIGSPSFKEWHIDKTPPELLKEAARWYQEAQDMIEDIPDELEDRLEDTREARVAKGFLKAKPVKQQVGRLRGLYRKYIGGRND